MAEVEITQEEVRGLDLSQVASMQLKDGTVVVVQGEGETGYDQNEGEFAQEELAQDEYGEVDYQDQSNQLRARPMMVVPPPKPMYPKPMGVPLVPPVGRPGLKPPVLVKPVPPRGPVRHVVPVPFRARPGMPMPGPRPIVAPKPVVRPGMPFPVPVGRPPVPVKPVPQVRPGMPVKPVGVPQRPLVSGPKPTVNQIIQAPGVPFRSRPGEAEEDYDFQEEEYAEDEYYENDDQAEGSENQLRAKPFGVPVVAPRPVPMGMKPRVVPVGPVPVRPVPVVAPKPVMVPGPKRGPVRVPVVGPNTFQPKVFRARPVVRPPPMNTFHPMAPPMAPPRALRPPVLGPKRYAYGFGPVLRSRPRSASYDPQEYDDECEYQYNEGC